MVAIALLIDSYPSSKDRNSSSHDRLSRKDMGLQDQIRSSQIYIAEFFFQRILDQSHTCPLDMLVMLDQ